jgi:hypothetical protein
MALLTVAQCKDFLRIEHTAEDTPLALWLAMAFAQCEAELGRPIAGVSRSWTDDACSHRAYGIVDQLIVPVTPFDIATLAIEDTDGLTLTTTDDYYAPVTGWEGVVRARPGISFSNGPYTLTATVGLDEAAEYATLIEPMLNAAMLDVVSDRWHRRNANATSESTGGGVSTSYMPSGLPTRAAELLNPWRLIRI